MAIQVIRLGFQREVEHTSNTRELDRARPAWCVHLPSCWCCLVVEKFGC